MRHRAWALMLLTLAACGWAQTAPAPALNKGKIVEVKVYRGQALVTREVAVDLKAGPQEVVVSELPEQIVPDSLYATGDDNISIRSVRFRSAPASVEPRPEVRALDEQIKKQQRVIAGLEAQQEALEARGKFLDSLEMFAATKTSEDMQRGTLNPQALQSTAKFIFDQRDAAAQSGPALAAQLEDAQEALNLLHRQRAELTQSEQSTVRDAVVFVEAAQAGPATLALSYLVNGVGWAPAYSARLNDSRDKLQMEYHAVVTQMSGEDWPQVRLTLSTSHPRMQASAPILSPLRINLTAAVPAAGKPTNANKDVGDAQAFAARKRELSEQLRGGYGYERAAGQVPEQPQAQAAGEAAPPASLATQWDETEGLVQSNLLAARLQNLELNAPDEAVRGARSAGALETEGLAVDYEIPGQVSLQSRRDQQMFLVAAPELKAGFYYTAVPLLTDYVYQAAEAVNTSDWPLLAGPYNAYIGRAFAGVGSLGLVARGQSLTIGCGTETRLRAARELEDKTTDLRGGNKVVKYTYRVKLQNFTDQPVKVRVYDRLPLPPDQQVTVTLAEPQPALSTDPLYLSAERPRGLLRWDVEVPADASGAKAYTFTYQFTLEFDKNYDIGELPAEASRAAADKVRSELQSLMDARQLRQ
jgi:hypothetical protein